MIGKKTIDTKRESEGQIERHTEVEGRDIQPEEFCLGQRRRKLSFWDPGGGERSAGCFLCLSKKERLLPQHLSPKPLLVSLNDWDFVKNNISVLKKQRQTGLWVDLRPARERPCLENNSNNQNLSLFINLVHIPQRLCGN